MNWLDLLVFQSTDCRKLDLNQYYYFNCAQLKYCAIYTISTYRRCYRTTFSASFKRSLHCYCRISVCRTFGRALLSLSVNAHLLMLLLLWRKLQVSILLTFLRRPNCLANSPLCQHWVNFHKVGLVDETLLKHTQQILGGFRHTWLWQIKYNALYRQRKNALFWHPPADSNYARLVINQPSTQSSEGMHPRLSEASFAKPDNFILVRPLVPCHYFKVNKV